MVTREALKPAPQPRSVTILGSTGSVGRNTIDIISRDPDAYAVEALTAQDNAALLIEQATALRPRFVAIGNEAHYPDREGRPWPAPASRSPPAARP